MRTEYFQGEYCPWSGPAQTFEDGTPISLYDQYANEVHESEF